MRLERHEKPQESKVMKFVNMAGTAIMLNLIFLVACIPVVTIGPAFSGLYSGVRFMIRGDGPIRGFWEGFKTKLARTIPAGILMIAAVVFFVLNVNDAYNFAMDPEVQALYADGGSWQVFIPLIQYALMAIPVLMVFSTFWLLNIYIDYSLMDWLKNCVNMIVKAPQWVLMTAVLMWLPVVLFFWFPAIFWAVAIIFIAAWYVLSAFASTLFLKETLVDLKKVHLQEYGGDEEEE